jgi:hypothetical protein
MPSQNIKTAGIELRFNQSIDGLRQQALPIGYCLCQTLRIYFESLRATLASVTSMALVWQKITRITVVHGTARNSSRGVSIKKVSACTGAITTARLIREH